MAERHSVWDHITDHLKVAAVLAFLAFAATFSPKASAFGTWACTLAAWALALMVVAGLPTVKASKRPRIPVILAAAFFGFGSFRYARWLTATNEEKKVNDTPSTILPAPAINSNTAPLQSDQRAVDVNSRAKQGNPSKAANAKAPKDLTASELRAQTLELTRELREFQTNADRELAQTLRIADLQYELAKTDTKKNGL